jgi:hypothetical protein
LLTNMGGSTVVAEGTDVFCSISVHLLLRKMKERLGRESSRRD